MSPKGDYPEPSFPELVQAASFEMPSAEYARRAIADKASGYTYFRYGNPTVRRLEERLAQLEGGEDAVCLSSGMAAIGALLISAHLDGRRLILASRLYGGTTALTRELIAPLGAKVNTFDSTSPDSLAGLMAREDRPALVLVESPANPTLELADIAALAKLCHEHQALLAVDSTFATPVLQRPLELGADLVVHSLTKFISGHGQVGGGAIVARRRLTDPIRHRLVELFGATLDPFAAWLTLAGLITLPLRMERACQTAEEVASFLAGHPKVSRVHYPFLPDHPQHDLARRQMRWGGALVAFEVRGGAAAAERVVESLRLIRHRLTLGDAESSILHPASTSHHALSPEEREALGISESLLRLSVGVEPAGELISDLDQALSRAGS